MWHSQGAREARAGRWRRGVQRPACAGSHSSTDRDGIPCWGQGQTEARGLTTAEDLETQPDSLETDRHRVLPTPYSTPLQRGDPANPKMELPGNPGWGLGVPTSSCGQGPAVLQKTGIQFQRHSRQRIKYEARTSLKLHLEARLGKCLLYAIFNLR